MPTLSRNSFHHQLWTETDFAQMAQNMVLTVVTMIYKGIRDMNLTLFLNRKALMATLF